MNLNRILKQHTLWFVGDPAGTRADLHGANLWGADLHGANLCEADLSGAVLCEADLCGADLCGANLCEAGLREADLRRADLNGANLHGANLNEADLSGANLDFSCWPLWCGSLNAVVDNRLKAQLAYHLLSLAPELREGPILALANTFHRIGIDVDSLEN